MADQSQSSRWGRTPGLVASAVVLIALTMVISCGDPVLPSDYTGPPASAVSGTLVPGAGSASKDASRPQLSLEWLSGALASDQAGSSLIGQPLSYRRSAKLDNDWEIGVALPAGNVTFERGVGSGLRVRIAVAKMVYFDDRDGNGHLDWSCLGLVCDQVKAVSSEFVLYVENPPYCQVAEGVPARPKLAPGYYYFSFDGTTLRQRARDEGLSFALDERPLSEADPTAALNAFVTALVRSWMVSPLNGC